MAVAETARLIASLELKDLFSGKVGQIDRSLGKLDKSIDHTASRSYQAGQQIGIGIKKAAILVIGAAGAIATGFTGALKVAGDFETQLNTINTIAHANATDLKGIGDAIRKVAKDTATPLNDLTQGYYDLLSAGIKAKDATNVLTAANTLAIGGLGTTAETVDLLTTAINTYGGDATKAASDADIFAKAIERGKVTAADLAQTFATVGPIAAAAGIDIKELGAAYAQLTAAGVPAAEAATETRSAILALEKTTPALDKLEKATHKNYLAIASKQGLVVALQQMRDDAHKAHVPLTDLLGRVEALSFTLATTGTNFKGYQDNLTAMGNAAGTAASQMSEREKGLNFQLGKLKALGKDALISLASPTLPKVAGLFERLNKTIGDPKVQANISALGDRIAGLFNDSNINAGIDLLKGAFETFKTTAPILQESAKATFGFIQAGVSLFKSLPAPLQGLLVGGFALNKLTGGLVTNIAGGLADLIGKSRGSSPASPVFVSDVSGGLGGAAGAAGKGGLGTLGKVVVGVTVLGIAYEAGTVIGKAFADVLPPELKGPGGRGASDSQLAHERATAASTPILPTDFSALLNANAREDRNALHADLGALGGKITDDLGGVKDILKGASAEFIGAARDLARSKGTAAIIKAADAVTALIGKGRGGAGQTENVLKSLERQLKNTHDPKLEAALKADIRKVQGLLPGRQFAAKELAKANDILRSHESENRKIVDLKAVQKALLDRGLPHAASVIAAKIDAEKRALTYANQQTAAAIKDKDLSVKVSVPFTVNNFVSVRSTIAGNRTYTLAGNVRIGTVGVN